MNSRSSQVVTDGGYIATSLPLLIHVAGITKVSASPQPSVLAFNLGSWSSALAVAQALAIRSCKVTSCNDKRSDNSEDKGHSSASSWKAGCFGGEFGTVDGWNPQQPPGMYKTLN